MGFPFQDQALDAIHFSVFCSSKYLRGGRLRGKIYDRQQLDSHVTTRKKGTQAEIAFQQQVLRHVFHDNGSSLANREATSNQLRAMFSAYSHGNESSPLLNV
jgi:hypothetical protein